MKLTPYRCAPAFLLTAALLHNVTWAQGVPNEPPPPFPQDDPGGMRGPGGPGGPQAPERKIVKDFDENENGRLDGNEFIAARAELKKNPSPTRGGGMRGGRGGGPGGPGGPENRPATSAGAKISPSDVANYPTAPLYDTSVVRTVFFKIDVADWEAELELFRGTDVDVPATMTVDGVEYPGVGLHFRGASSYFTVPKGSKRSLNVSVDHTDSALRLHGATTLNLLNSSGDPSMLSSLLYSRLAAPHIAAPKANFVQVVVNGESWGVFISVEQFNKLFVAAHWPQFKGEGARWKVPGSPQGSAGLDDKGDDVAAYKSRYEIKSKSRDEDWKDLMHLCDVLTNTPAEELEAKLQPILDIEGALWFLALDMVTCNSDGFWTRASDYSIYKDPTGVFHILPHDMNESFKNHGGGPGGPGGRRGGGMRGPQGPPPNGQGADAPPPDANRPRRGTQPEFSLPRPPQGEAMPPDGMPPMGDFGGPPPNGGGRPMGGGGTTLDPLTGLDDGSKALRSKLLAVPSLRARYLEHVKTLAREMTWSNLGPFITQERTLIAPFVEQDTRKLSTYEDFMLLTAADEATTGRAAQSLRAFFTLRSKYLLEYKPANATTKPATKNP